MAPRETETPVAETAIGEGTVVVGQLAGDEDLRILGRVEGSIDVEGALVVETTGIVKAEIKVRVAVIRGVVVGTITAGESVELAPGARMVGDVVAPRVIIAEGAAFRGRVDMGDLDLPRAELERAVRPVQVRPIHAGRPVAPRPQPQLRSSPPLPRMPPPPRPAPVRPPPMEISVEVAAAELSAGGPPPVPVSASALGARRKVVVKKK